MCGPGPGPGPMGPAPWARPMGRAHIGFWLRGLVQRSTYGRLLVQANLLNAFSNVVMIGEFVQVAGYGCSRALPSVTNLKLTCRYH